MDLVNELENDLALAFLVEKKYSEKIESTEVMALLSKVREILKPCAPEEKFGEDLLIARVNDKALAH